MKLSRNIINKSWFVGICSAVLVVVAVYSLMDFNSADERDDATVAKTQNERWKGFLVSWLGIARRRRMGSD